MEIISSLFVAVFQLAGFEVTHGHSAVSKGLRVRHVALPEPVLGPHQVHFFDGHALGLRDEEEGEEEHDRSYG